MFLFFKKIDNELSIIYSQHHLTILEPKQCRTIIYNKKKLNGDFNKVLQHGIRYIKHKRNFMKHGDFFVKYMEESAFLYGSNINHQYEKIENKVLNDYINLHCMVLLNDFIINYKNGIIQEVPPLKLNDLEILSYKTRNLIYHRSIANSKNNKETCNISTAIFLLLYANLKPHKIAYYVNTLIKNGIIIVYGNEIITSINTSNSDILINNTNITCFPNSKFKVTMKLIENFKYEFKKPKEQKLK